MLIFFAIACRPTLPEASGQPGPVSLTGTGAPVVRLLQSAAAITLPSSEPIPATSGSWPVSGPWESISSGVWRAESPVRLPARPYRAAPSGMALTQDGEPLSWYQGVVKTGWRIHGQGLIIHSAAQPAGVVLTDTTSTAEADRLSPMRSGLSAEAYIHHTVEIDGISQQSLLLPSGAAVGFAVSPAHARTLRFSLGMAPPTERGVSGSAEQSVRSGSDVLWQGTATHGEPWRTVSLQLPPGHAQLSFRVEADEAIDWDVVALGNPELVGPATGAGPRRILLVGIDTLRPDHLGVMGHERPTSPNLDAIAAQSILMTDAVAPAPRTRPSFRTATTGRWPLEAITAPTLGATLSQAGFATAGVVANVHLSPLLGLSAGYQHWSYHDGDIAENQVDRAVQWMTDHGSEDSFLFVHFMDPHVYYQAPEPHRDRFTEGLQQGEIPDRFNRWSILRREEIAPLRAEERAFIEGRYDGEISYLDAQLGRLFSETLALPGQTLIVLHSDHGEEFWEHGSFEHNHSLYQEVLSAMLWIRPPEGWTGGPHRIHGNASLADIAPTLYELLAIADPPPSDGRSLLPLIGTDQPLPDRALPLGHMMFDTERWGVLKGKGKYILHTDSGREELYDHSTDPAEQNDISSTTDLTPWRAALAAATGWPVLGGWRVRLTGLADPLTLTFSAPIEGAGVIDPESARPRRANLEWGEIPPKLPSDVAAVDLSADRQVLTITPGAQPTGTIYVLGPDSQTRATLGEQVVGDGHVSGQLRIEAGTVIVPSDSEAARLTAIADPESWDALKAMGYVE